MILPMARVQLLGPRDLLERALEFLQAQGVLELRAPSPAPAGAPALVQPRPPAAATAMRAARAEEALRRLEALAARLAGGRGAGEGRLPEPGSEELLARLGELETELDALEARRAALAEEAEALARFSRLIVALAPLGHGIDPALDPEIHGLELRSDPEAIALLRGEVRRLTGDVFELTARPLDAERTGVLLVVPRAHGPALTALLFERGVDEVKLPAACAGKPLVDVLLHVIARSRAIPAEQAQVEAERERLAERVHAPLAASAAAARALLGRLGAASACGETRFAFVVTGYMPAERVPPLREAVATELGDRVAMLARPPERREWSEVPVVLRNRSFVRPFERLLGLVPLPRYGSTDPTPWVAVFFPLFFGLVLGDVACGAAGLVVALVLRVRRVGGPLGRDLTWVALACALSALAFGVLFGEALGELGGHFGLHPLVLDRRRAFLTFLGVALGVGAVHVGVGMALGVAGALRAGHRREALGRVAKLGLLCAAAVSGAVAAGLLPAPALRPALWAGGALLAVAIGAEGPMAVLELVLGLGNVLSYTRLMALGLASVMLAEVANLVATTLRPAAAGATIGVLLHLVNFTLGLISPTVAALRLHYVEFFEKFYDEGGAPYRPFALGR
ncbi:ATPase [Anaeromyxobacter sp. Fw109-5]|uniref:ATPase n=1 Tax=Anaeromyxobacter sp. (strain Fw109-5) TaxID=404589 RepID=UPI000158A57C|nr:ATPase [Anaeromyxobacter sp. Fw109-5]ABS26770.1 V-type ATPase 116 kDa subunit [Anaeromyxobacter sp. Fw109-5]